MMERAHDHLLSKGKFFIFFIFFIFCFLATKLYSEEELRKKSAATKENLDFLSLETLSQTLYYLEKNYVEPEKTTLSQSIQKAIEGITQSLDPHTLLLPPASYSQLTMHTKGRFGGIGIIISQENKGLIIVSTIENSPAQKAGILVKDEIIAIDKIAVKQMTSAQILNKMRGLPGSGIELKIKRAGRKKALTLKIIRDLIKMRSVLDYELGSKIVLIKISSFQENTAQDLRSLLKKKRKLIKGLILDLRNNPGGLLDQAVAVADIFIEKGLLLSTIGRDPDEIQREFATSKHTYKKLPLIILINEGSASASEIVAGALQDHKRALILGTKSFGKGSVQTLIPLSDGSALKLTIARYYTPNNRSIQAQGISPDITVNKIIKIKAKEQIREKDLTGHMHSKELKEKKEKESSFKKWPSFLKKDYQMRTAFSYFHSWSIFKGLERKK